MLVTGNPSSDCVYHIMVQIHEDEMVCSQRKRHRKPIQHPVLQPENRFLPRCARAGQGC
jgi:hypothetical protein